MKALVVAVAAVVAGGLGYLWFLAWGWCDDRSPTGEHCRCWSSKKGPCCWCDPFAGDGPHALDAIS